MNNIIILERVAAVLCLGHIAINIATTVEQIRIAYYTGVKWETNIEFTTIAAGLLSVLVCVRWLTV